MILSTSQLAKYFCFIVWGELSSLHSLLVDCKCVLSEVHQNKECAWTIYADVEMINDLRDSFSNSGYFYSSWALFILCDVQKVLDWTANTSQYSTEESLQDLDWNKNLCANPDSKYMGMCSEVRMCWSRIVHSCCLLKVSAVIEWFSPLLSFMQRADVSDKQASNFSLVLKYKLFGYLTFHFSFTALWHLSSMELIAVLANSGCMQDPSVERFSHAEAEVLVAQVLTSAHFCCLVFIELQRVFQEAIFSSWGRTLYINLICSLILSS